MNIMNTTEYESPVVEIIEVAIEKGFATSGLSYTEELANDEYDAL